MSLTQISASAGSGKTYTLTRHFLELLLRASPLPQNTGCVLHGQNCGYSLAEILAATFTNKAAAEMKTRVVNGLKEEALRARVAGDDPARDQGEMVAERWVEQILRHYGSLNIRTIDSLLTSLVRLSALELGLPPDFELSFTAEEYFTPLYDALMDELAQDREAAPPGMGKNAAGLCPVRTWGDREAATPGMRADAATLRARLSEACRSLLYLSDFKGFTPKGRLHHLLLELVNRLLRDEETPLMDSGAIHARLNVLHAGMTDACRALLEILETESLEAGKNFLRFLHVCAAGAPYQPAPDSVYRNKPCLDECLNKASRGAASSRAESAFERALAAVAEYGAALPLFRHALQLAPLSELAHELFARMRERQDNLLPAPRLPALAGDLLSGDHGVSDALCRLGTRLSRLLLDEFQDTSREQWRAILPLAAESLSTGGSLTLVGDVKQAIYGWRGGDARLFDEAVAEPELRAIVPRAEYRELEDNWRSHPAVVAHNNAFFALLGQEQVARNVLSAMLPPHTPEEYRERAAQEAVHNFARARQNIPPQKDWNHDPKTLLAGVRLYQVNGPTVAHVQELVRERLQTLLQKELLPHWRCNDIAILVRSGDEAALAAAWLSAWGVPVVTENSFLLASHPLVGQLISFLSFLDYPLDDLAFWEFASAEGLLGPHRPCGAEWLAEVTRLYGKAIPLYQHFRRDFPAEWERCIEPFYSGAGLMSAYDTLLEAVKRFGILERLPAQAPFIRRLLELAHLAESRGHSSLAAFLAFWRGCKDDEKLPLPENMDAVRIMTMHKAKGLEFPVVILPFQHKGRRREADLAAVAVHGLPLLTRAGRELPDLYYPACITDELERLNLLYVAWTRPIYALHAFITRPASSSTPLTRALEELTDQYWQESGAALCEWEVLDAANRPAPPSDHADSLARELAADEAAPSTTPLPDLLPAQTDPSWRPMNWLPRLKIYRSPLPDLYFTPRQRGILVHLCLEHLLVPADTPPGERQEHVLRAVRQGMRLFPLPLDDPERIAAEMAGALSWFASLPEAPLWLARGMREQGIMDEHGRMHRVDLLVDKGDGSMHAVDYKTGQAGQAADEHHAQVRRYMRLAAQATGRPVRGFLAYLDEQRLLEVRPEGMLP